jgi:hypothetical protein
MGDFSGALFITSFGAIDPDYCHEIAGNLRRAKYRDERLRGVGPY